MNSKIRVLIVDDSSVACRVLANLLNDPAIEVIGTARDAYEARDKILELHPDVVTLDIEMPKMDGLTFLRILQKHHPVPVIIISALTQTGSRAALDALEAGAVDVVAKPFFAKDQMIERIKGAAAAKISRPAVPAIVHSPAKVDCGSFHPRQVILMGASTGGTEAIKFVLSRLPDSLPGICVVQHIPPQFSRTFADRLNEICAVKVREAVEGDIVERGLALIAPGDFHMTLAWDKDRYRVALNKKPLLHYVRPAVDMLFDSAALCAEKYCTSVLLTGMGSDGARGMQNLKAAGGFNLAQNEETCVVYGMPRAAVELGVVDKILPLDRIPDGIVEAARVGALKAAAKPGPRIPSP